MREVCTIKLDFPANNLGLILGDYLVMHLSELVRLAFIAATATSDQLKLEGLKTLQVSKYKLKIY